MEIIRQFFFDKKRKRKIYPCVSKLATVHGLPKTHKMLSDSDDFYHRQIFSSTDTYIYNLAEFLAELLDPVIPREHCAKDQLRFCQEIAVMITLVTYDACSLFTSITLLETIDTAVELIFESNPQLKITKHELTEAATRVVL